MYLGGGSLSTEFIGRQGAITPSKNSSGLMGFQDEAKPPREKPWIQKRACTLHLQTIGSRCEVDLEFKNGKFRVVSNWPERKKDMTEGEAADDFQHQYRDRLQAMKLNRYEASELRKGLDNLKREESPPDVTARGLLLDEYERLHDTIIKDLSETSDPQILFERSLRSLDRLERFRFVIDNLLETVKRDDSLNNILQTYYDVGLITRRANDPTLPTEKRVNPWPWNRSAGDFLRKIMRGLKKLALTLFEILVNALKAIPRLAEIEIRPNVGISGPFPTIQFDFDLKAKGITIHELFEALAGSLDEKPE